MDQIDIKSFFKVHNEANPKSEELKGKILMIYLFSIDMKQNTFLYV